jgi:hypothetical protein
MGKKKKKLCYSVVGGLSVGKTITLKGSNEEASPGTCGVFCGLLCLHHHPTPAPPGHLAQRPRGVVIATCNPPEISPHHTVRPRSWSSAAAVVGRSAVAAGVREGACIGGATIPQPWTLRLILNAAALAAASPTLLFRSPGGPVEKEDAETRHACGWRY